MNYICTNCGGGFDRPVTHADTHALPFFREEHAVSPCCRAPFGAAARCEDCSALVERGTLRHDLCPDCAEQTVSRLQGILHREFTAHQLLLLDDAFESIPLSRWELARPALASPFKGSCQPQAD